MTRQPDRIHITGPGPICALCQQCCTQLPGGAAPSDMGDDIEAGIRERLDTGLWALDWWDTDERSDKLYYLRPATRTRVGRVFDGSFGGACVFHGPTGCQLGEARPLECKALSPRQTWGGECHGMGKFDLVQLWRDHQAVLLKVAHEVALARGGGGAIPEDDIIASGPGPWSVISAAQRLFAQHGLCPHGLVRDRDCYICAVDEMERSGNFIFTHEA